MGYSTSTVRTPDSESAEAPERAAVSHYELICR